MTDKELQVVNIEDYAMTPEKIQNQVNIIQKVMHQVMKDGEHFGTVPGCGPKKTLLKSGAEKLCVTFRLAPSYEIRKTDLKDGHREYELACTLTHISSGLVVGQGVGACSTMEGKFRYRVLERTCPKCDAQAIIKGKAEYGGGWLCWKKKDGCGGKFKEGDPSIENQEAGKVEHDNPADYYNTVLKMGKKRAMVDATLTATAASDLFTQDVEDMPEVLPPMKPPETQTASYDNEGPEVKRFERKTPDKPPPTTQFTTTDDPGFPPIDESPCTKEQATKLYKIGEQNELTNREVEQLCNWRKVGDKLTSAEAEEMIGDFSKIVGDYIDYINEIKK